MKKLEVNMGCGACKWKITTRLNELRITQFKIDMNTNIITFNNNNDFYQAMYAIRQLNYSCQEIENEIELSDEELLLIEYEMKNKS